MMDHERIAMLELGLGQEAISSEELQRLADHIEAGKPVLLSGLVWDRDTGTW